MNALFSFVTLLSSVTALIVASASAEIIFMKDVESVAYSADTGSSTSGEGLGRRVVQLFFLAD